MNAPHTIYVDAATIDGVINALSVPPDRWTPWVAEAAINATAALISVPNVRIAHSPNDSLAGDATGVVDFFYRSLAKVFEAYTPTRAASNHALRNTCDWARRNADKLGTVLSELEADHSFQAWLEWTTTIAAKDHAVRHGSLFDKQFISPIAAAIHCPTADVEHVHQLSTDPMVVDGWVKGRGQTEDSQIAFKAFSLAALLRGRFHDRLSELQSESVIHHPLRHCVLKPLRVVPGSSAPDDDTLEALSKLIIAVALSNRGIRNRLDAYVASVSDVRIATLARHISIAPEGAQHLAVEKAITGFKASGSKLIPKHYQKLDQVINWCSELSLGAFVSFVLSPWLFPMGFAPKLLGEPRPMSRIASSKAHLQRLVESVPGRLTPARHFTSKEDHG